MIRHSIQYKIAHNGNPLLWLDFSIEWFWIIQNRRIKKQMKRFKL